MADKHPPSGTIELDLSYLQDRIVIDRMYGQWNVEGAKKATDQLLNIVKSDLIA